ncbi:YidC/Oxa1 family membrane protein insertase [Candidatus Pacebacteria bacterium]|nr:YidC/Oxa1 family membrane protein insertase [Candidatus Paceibacterota bacterium]
MKELFNNLLFEPLYNALVFLIDIIPGADVGLAVVVLTIIVKLILFPLSKKAVHTQIKMRDLQKPLDELKEKYKNNREEMGRAMLELYKKHKINPFSGILLIFIQIPVILALYWVFLRGGLPEINTSILYSFVPAPDYVNMEFLGFLNIAEAKGFILALLAAVSQHFQARFSFPKQPPAPKGEKPSFKDDMMRGMGIQIKWVLPIVVFFISYGLISVVALYWVVSNLFAIGQELYIREKIKKPAEAEKEKEESDRDENKEGKVIEAEIVKK